MNEWYEWREAIWNQLATRFYPGLAAFEQYVLRSFHEKRCAECGLPGEHQHESLLVRSVPHFWLCTACER